MYTFEFRIPFAYISVYDHNLKSLWLWTCDKLMQGNAASSSSSRLRSSFIGMGFSPSLVDRAIEENGNLQKPTFCSYLFVVVKMSWPLIKISDLGECYEFLVFVLA